VKRKRLQLAQTVHFASETDAEVLQACLIDGAGALIVVNVTENC
jgi:hypothetical protein